MEIFGIPMFALVIGLLGYIWKLRNDIVKLIPGEKDDKLLDTIEGIAESLHMDVDEAAKKSRGKLKKEIKKELKGK